jgi:hypothetical protein
MVGGRIIGWLRRSDALGGSSEPQWDRRRIALTAALVGILVVAGTAAGIAEASGSGKPTTTASGSGSTAAASGGSSTGPSGGSSSGDAGSTTTTTGGLAVPGTTVGTSPRRSTTTLAGSGHPGNSLSSVWAGAPGGSGGSGSTSPGGSPGAAPTPGSPPAPGPTAGPGVGTWRAVTCPTDEICIAVGADSASDGVAAVSSDGGTTWTAGSMPAGTPALVAVACPDTSHCVALGQATTAVSTDGGLTWTTQVVGDPSTTTLLGVTCTSPTTCLAVGFIHGSAPPTGRILRSADGGATWTDAQIPPGAWPLGAVACSTARRCAAIGTGFVTSDDGGQTWQDAPVDGGTQGLTAVACPSASFCLAIGPYPQCATAVSTDGGATWTDVAWPSGTGPLGSIACVAPSNCLVADGSSLPGNTATTIYAGSDGGATWTPIAGPGPLTSINGIAWSSLSHCVVVGTEGSTPATAVTWDAQTWSTATHPAG